jgi:phosphatidylinositol alpha-mannosyltransferase
MVCPYSLTRPGGVQGQALHLTRELRELGVDVRLLAPCDGPPPAPGVVSVGPTVEWETNGSIAPIATGSAVARRTLSALRAIEPDVVHLHEPLVPGPTLSALLGHEGPMIGTFHIAGEYPISWVRPALPAIVGRLSQRFAVSEAAAALAREMYHQETEVLWNGIDLDDLAGVEPWPATRPVVMFLGRHEPRKGLGVLLSAWPGLDRDAVLWVGGSGPQTDELRRRRERDVEWLGFVGDVEKMRRLAAATVYCAPATGGESFGIVLLEAMAAGVPVVATSIEGYANVARDGREAILVPPDDPDALRSALRTVLDDADRRAALADAGRKRAHDFSMHSLAVRYAEAYAKVVAEAAV